MGKITKFTEKIVKETTKHTDASDRLPFEIIQWYIDAWQQRRYVRLALLVAAIPVVAYSALWIYFAWCC